MIEFSIVTELKSIREQKSILSEREKILIAPILSDLNTIPMVYKWFKEIMASRNPKIRIERAYQRKKFLLIIVLLFAPCMLTGARMPFGIRKALKEVFPSIKPCTISNNLTDVLFIYQRYKDFQQDVDNIYTEILCRLGIGSTPGIEIEV
ncbi:MAG: hypothetical protein RR293_07735 [Bacteroidales bacterium]